MQDDFATHEMAIMHLTINGNMVTVSEPGFTLMTMKVQVPLLMNLKKIAMDNGMCYGRLICMHGYMPAWYRISLMKTLLTPTFFKLIVPADGVEKKIVFRHETFERLYESTTFNPRVGLSTREFY